MVPKLDLFYLIKSLTKNEKTYFKNYSNSLIARKDIKYIDLFDAIDDMEEYDETRIKEKFQSEKFIKQLHVRKNYLFKLLLKSLRSFHGNFSIEAEINTLFNEGLLLYQKGLYGLSYSIFAAAKQRALKYEYFLKCADLNLKIINIVRNELRSKENETDLYNQNVVFINNASEINQLLLLNRKMYVLQRNAMNGNYTNKLFREARKILADPIVKKAYLSPLFRMREICLDIYSSYHRITNEPFKIYEFRKKKIELIEAQHNGGVYWANGYLTALYNFCNVLAELGRYKELLKVLNRIDDLKADPLYSSNNFQIKIFEFVSNTRLQAYFKLNNLKGVRETLGEVDKKLSDYEYKISPVGFSFLCFNAAFSLFHFKKYREVLRWINRKMAHGKSNITHDVYQQLEILSLLTHMELKNFDLLDSIAKSLTRNYSLKKVSGDEKLLVVIKLLLQYVVIPSVKAGRYEGFKELKLQIDKFYSREKIVQLKDYLIFISDWAKRKMEENKLN